MTTATALSDFAERLDRTAEDTEALLGKLLSAIPAPPLAPKGPLPDPGAK